MTGVNTELSHFHRAFLHDLIACIFFFLSLFLTPAPACFVQVTSATVQTCQTPSEEYEFISILNNVAGADDKCCIKIFYFDWWQYNKVNASSICKSSRQSEFIFSWTTDLSPIVTISLTGLCCSWAHHVHHGLLCVYTYSRCCRQKHRQHEASGHESKKAETSLHT